ncbi:MAG: hypothetical protein R3B90_01635 [Planctomycetaceae bacterium]
MLRLESAGKRFAATAAMLAAGLLGTFNARQAIAWDQVFADDVIVQGSLGVGVDTVNNEAFGADTIRIKENNLRIHFDDTSVGTFPANDWRIIVNETTDGALNHFSIEDSTASSTPFRIVAGAPNNSLLVDDNGNVGFGTASPALELHAVDGDTAALRLEQDGSGGFTPHSWDIAGNETNFFIRDVTSGSRLPFRIRPGAPTSSIDIAADGDVGLGTGSPCRPAACRPHLRCGWTHRSVHRKRLRHHLGRRL